MRAIHKINELCLRKCIVLCIALLSLCLALPAQAQDEPAPDTSQVKYIITPQDEPPPDSTQQSPALTPENNANIDIVNSRLPKGHTPSRVLTRALLVPGWGQIYNRQYFRAAIYYAGLGAGGYFIYNSNQNYILFRHATLYATYRDTPEEERPEQYRDSFAADYEAVLRAFEDFTPDSELSEEDQASRRARLENNIRSQRDIFRRRRDLNILLTFGIWGLGIIESFVSAHLLHFDVSEDLTFQVVPTPRGTAATMTYKF